MCQSKEEMGPAVSSFYKGVVDDIRFAKQQQWYVTNYVSLVYAALLALNLQLDDPTWFEMTGLTVLTLATTVLGSCVLWSLRNWLRRLEERLNAIYRTYFSVKEQNTLSINQDRPRTRHDVVSVTFIAIIILGAAVVLYFVWSPPMNADDEGRVTLASFHAMG